MKRILIIITSLIIGMAIGITIDDFLPKDYPQSVKKVEKASIRKVTTENNREQTPIIKISQEKAINEFHRLYSNAKVKEIKLAIEHQSYVYDISGYDTKKDCTIKIDASTGDILGQSTLRHDYDAENDEDDLRLNKVISRKEASQIAIQKVGSGDAREWNLEINQAHTYPIWTVKVIDNSEIITVKINAISKEIIDD